jgi:hypothetical protein
MFVIHPHSTEMTRQKLHYSLPETSFPHYFFRLTIGSESQKYGSGLRGMDMRSWVASKSVLLHSLRQEVSNLMNENQ